MQVRLESCNGVALNMWLRAPPTFGVIVYKQVVNGSSCCGETREHMPEHLPGHKHFENSSPNQLWQRHRPRGWPRCSSTCHGSVGRTGRTKGHKNPSLLLLLPPRPGAAIQYRNT